MSLQDKTPQQLIEDCQGLVRSLAAKIHRRLPSYVDLEELISYGQVGLAEAARDFDPGRGGQFTTFAYYRIRGSIYDGLAKMTWVSRSQYHRMRYEQLSNDVVRGENEEDTTAGSGRLEDDARWLRDLTGKLAVVYFATHPDSEQEEIPLVDRATPAPQVVAIARETSRKLHELIASLPQDAASLIRSVYFEGLTLTEAGVRLGVSKAWASRLHARTLQQLARALRRIGLDE